MTIQEAQQLLVSRLRGLYDTREASNIADWVLERVTGRKKTDRLTNNNELLSVADSNLLSRYTDELLTHKPVQYVLQEAWFCGMKLFVNEHVLIPRPETEELVNEAGSKKYEVRSMKPEVILDIGTGSGCIPIALKKKLPACEMYACDISEKALEVARKNATDQGTDIHFLQLNFLDRSNWHQLPEVDIIVSNPPYIPQQDKQTMHKNVLDFEPHIALFVENNDPLLFYKAIGEFALLKLKPGGAIYAEIHEDLGDAVKALFIEKGFSNVTIKKDMQGKDRILFIVNLIINKQGSAGA